ncbi:hypothetical protein PENTCL1PPCAC_22294, partial [Pristionchus entomophagus]
SPLAMNFFTLLLVLLSLLSISFANQEITDENVLLVKRSPFFHPRGPPPPPGRGGPGRNCGGPSTSPPATATTTTARERVPGF